MSKKKALPDDVGDFFGGRSVFFYEQQAELSPKDIDANEKQTIGKKEIQSPTPTKTPTQEERPQASGKKRYLEESAQKDSRDVMPDVVTSYLQNIDLKEWQEIIENTETQNSALRLTSVERFAVEDVVSELRRQDRVKTSMNEMARLGLLFLIYDFKRNKQKSILYTVKKA